MKLKKYKVWFYFILITSCIEPFDIENLSFEKNLVVNAVITNEFKHHMIELSNTVELNSDEVKFETDAKISIIDSNQLVHRFIEVSAGKYKSEEKFKAELNLEYKLIIETKDGQVYESTSEKLAEETSVIEQINTDVIQDNSETKVILSVDTKSFDDGQKFYRYEYVETYKVTPTFWSKDEIKVLSDTPPYLFKLEEKEIDRFCYRTQYSKKIILKETTNLSESSIRKFPVRSIPIEDMALSIRYSILVKQFSINQETYDYYKLLERFSVSDDVFSQTQVGKLPGNVKNIKTDKKAVGYFDISSISYKRIFFDREKVTDTFYSPKNLADCYFIKPTFVVREESPLLEIVNSGHFVFYAINEDLNCPGGLYIMVPRECGDCRHLGPAEKPDFWID